VAEPEGALSGPQLGTHVHSTVSTNPD